MYHILHKSHVSTSAYEGITTGSWMNNHQRDAGLVELAHGKWEVSTGNSAYKSYSVGMKFLKDIDNQISKYNLW